MDLERPRWRKVILSVSDALAGILIVSCIAEKIASNLFVINVGTMYKLALTQHSTLCVWVMSSLGFRVSVVRSRTGPKTSLWSGPQSVQSAVLDCLRTGPMVWSLVLKSQDR